MYATRLSELRDQMPLSPKRRRPLVLLGLPLAALLAYTGWLMWLGREFGPDSRCYGTTSNGRLEGPRRLPYSGENYRSYILLGYLAGRTFMHRSVRDATLASYVTVAQQRPELRFVYAETGWPWGGRFAPHKTHANGTSVDFHVPVRTLDGAVAELPASPLNKLGYSIDFDSSGRSGGMQLDFEAMALHLLALDKAARASGIGITRVIFDVRMQPKLFATEAGARAARTLPFSKSQSWVPHDQHYHVDFAVPCK